MKTYPSFDSYSNFRGKLPEQVDSEGSAKFLEEHPGYFQSEYNANLLTAFVEIHAGGCCSAWNLSIAYNDLRNDGLLENPPPSAQPIVDKNRGIIQTRDDVMMEYHPDAAEVAALEKLADNSDLNDHQRKARLKKLARLAYEQRASARTTK